MFARRLLVGGSLLLLFAATVSAQPPGRRGGGFGRRGFGGPGEAQSSAPALLRIPEVRQELGTSDEQNKHIDEVLAALGDQMRASFGSFQELQNLDEAERAKRLADARAASESAGKEAEEKLSGTLDQKQLRRLNELRLQREGAGALLRPDVAKKLGLSEEQQQQLREIQDKSRGPAPGGGSFQQMSDEERREFFTQMQKRREAADAEMLAVLTGDQRQALAEMKGAEFKFPQPQGGFGGGFGPGGGFGAGGNAVQRQRPPIKKREP